MSRGALKNFANDHGYEVYEILGENKTWSELKYVAHLQGARTDLDFAGLSAALTKVTKMSGPLGIARVKNFLRDLQAGNISKALAISGSSALAIRYQLWAKKGSKIGCQPSRNRSQNLLLTLRSYTPKKNLMFGTAPFYYLCQRINNKCPLIPIQVSERLPHIH